MQPLRLLRSLRRPLARKIALPPAWRHALLAATATAAVVIVGFVSLSWLAGGAPSGGSTVDVSMPAKAVIIASGLPAPGGGAPPHAPSIPASDVRPLPASPGPGAEPAVVVPAVASTAFTGLPQRAVDANGLPPAPDGDVIEERNGRQLPRIGSDGQEPREVYARPFQDEGNRARLAVVVAGVGLSDAVTEAAIDRLPGAITLIFDPYGSGLAESAARARSAGHEVLLALPMESADAPFEDQGSYGLSTALKPDQNLQRLHYLLGSLPGYVGVIGVGGSRYAASADRIRPVLLELKHRGLLYMEGTPEVQPVTLRAASDLGLPRVGVDVAITAGSTGAEVDSRLKQLEAMAQDRGFGVGLVPAEPVAMHRLARWAAQLDPRRFVLAPVSATLAGPAQR